MKRVLTVYIFIGLVMMAVLPACSDRLLDDSQRHGRDGILVATIAGGEGADTRVLRSAIDNWSYTRFSDVSDVIGFYSLYGDLDGPDGNGPFTNQPMEFAKGESTSNSSSDDKYWRGVFRPQNNINYDIGLITNDVKSSFVYFPYCESMEEEGMELRVLGDDGIYRCVDALAISKIDDKLLDDMMSGSFNHTFAEVVILRGYGFDNPKPGQEQIKVVTTKPYSHAKVVDNGNAGHSDWKILKPDYDPDHTDLTEQQCREWEAWDGAPYKDNTGKEYPAKYVIIPTAISGDRSTVNYVELYDNNGTLHKVTTFGLMNEGDKRVSPNERYWLTIKLEGLVPTIYPFAITPWEEETRYTEQRAKGINTPQEFMQFVMAYNSYNSGNRSENSEDALKTYGDKYVVNGEVGWHFHINSDIDLSSLSVDNLCIAELCDTLDGRTNTLKGIKSNKAFITELQSKGCVRNLNITGLNVTSTSDSAAGSAAGGLIDRMTGGLIIGCSVDGRLTANVAAGLAVGQFTAGTIKTSSFSGLVVGASSDEYKKGLIGEYLGEHLEGSLEDVNTSSLIFQTGN